MRSKKVPTSCVLVRLCFSTINGDVRNKVSDPLHASHHHEAISDIQFIAIGRRLIKIQEHIEGVLLPVRALPGSRLNAIRGVQDGSLKVSVTQVAEKGKANKAIRDLLAKSLGLKKSQVELVSGGTSAQKAFLIRKVTSGDLRCTIERLTQIT